MEIKELSLRSSSLNRLNSAKSLLWMWRILLWSKLRYVTSLGMSWGTCVRFAEWQYTQPILGMHLQRVGHAANSLEVKEMTYNNINHISTRQIIIMKWELNVDDLPHLVNKKLLLSIKISAQNPTFHPLFSKKSVVMRWEISCWSHLLKWLRRVSVSLQHKEH